MSKLQKEMTDLEKKLKEKVDNMYNERKITMFANKASLIDFVDTMDNVFKDQYSKKVTININNFDPATKSRHKEKYVAFFMDAQDVLMLCNAILDDSFENQTYNMVIPGYFREFGGGSHKEHGIISRIFEIKYELSKEEQEKIAADPMFFVKNPRYITQGKYLIKNSIAFGKKGEKDEIIPLKDENGKMKVIDFHSVQIAKWEVKKMMSMLKPYIEQKIAFLQERPLHTQGQATELKKAVENEKKQVKKEEEKPDDFFSQLGIK